ncbi:MAG: hypothetical protein IJM72_06295 [Deltaproteobacteria bacterium]|nr:hypothetical protein [Deltaproteobacteria bacterium]MBR0191312.1 hypothetical protein [Thermoguttaceae bacterium]
MKKRKPRIQVTSTLSPEVHALLPQIEEPLSKFLDHAIPNELSRSATATSRLAEALHEVIRATVQDAIREALAAGRKSK